MIVDETDVLAGSERVQSGESCCMPRAAADAAGIKKVAGLLLTLTMGAWP